MSQCTCNFISYTLARSVTVNIIIPGPTFSCSSPCHIPKAPYPVLYLLHGGNGNENIWLRYTSLERYAEEQQIAIVTCNLENTAGCDAEYTVPFGLSPSGICLDDSLCDCRKISFQRFMTQELPEYVKGLFPVSAKQKDTYLAGEGASVFSVLRYACSAPGLYRAVGLFEPVCQDFPNDSDVLFPSAPFSSSISKNLKRNGLFYIASSKSEAMTSFLKGLDISPVWKKITGTEHWDVCDRALASFLDLLPRSDFYAGKPKRKI